MSEQAKTIFLKDYKAPSHKVHSLSLHFELGETETTVISIANYQRQPTTPIGQSLELMGENLELTYIKLNGLELSTDNFKQNPQGIEIFNPPTHFSLEIKTKIHPETNTSLQGLYRSSGIFCTQCEAQGFRNITYFLDRPDVLTAYTTHIIADQTSCPVLLSNGNLVGSGKLADNKHWARWEDPFLKPSYLFALVAGNLKHIEDQYTTQSGRKVALRIFAQPHNIDKCDFAMGALKRSMKWDEDRFGLEYDLDIFMIVAVDDFNMGAMENKGLNVFNSKRVFATPETTTDYDIYAVESVIGHEYFHNWTGNRVTCRDWFQLSLKEGLTVFRDQEFSSDLNDRSIQRINDVQVLRDKQFTEDASPLAHPIRPSSYIEIDNFYTPTVYEKGSEVVRMYQTLLGRDGFRKGVDLYFKRHDGQAVTTEDFLSAMADANSQDLSLMQRWYEQAGTPDVQVTMSYDSVKHSCTLTFKQSCRPTPETNVKKPFLIPIKLGLLNSKGQDMLDSSLFILTDSEQSVTFTNIHEVPIPSLLREFSAPVNLHYPYTASQLAFLFKHDSDNFNRWEAGQKLFVHTFKQLLIALKTKQAMLLPSELTDAVSHIISDKQLSNGFKAVALKLPTHSILLREQPEGADPHATYQVLSFMQKHLAESLQNKWQEAYQQLNVQEPFKATPEAMGKRAFKALCLEYLGCTQSAQVAELAYKQFATATNMTDQESALITLIDIPSIERDKAINEFINQWKTHNLVVDMWFKAQASSSVYGNLDKIKELVNHSLFDISNPNKIRSVISAFALYNLNHFHAEDGSGYCFIADMIIKLHQANPQIAAAISKQLQGWKSLEPKRSSLIKIQLERILQTDNLSSNVYEIVSKSLKN